ncbi:CZB domain-containing protein [Hymenobacter arizonensis]|uniref:Chemoreceptor zinc-binding domain-containing protein n=1 Tax=Hymenobacter arizonensis TaxID=1227077 RepID=A0A1I6AY50_HYMAR|nr:CZB domain-containing protein [Hymenobacter arizonensis]SFQ73576.1 Chemoreceptor zinc-binding domain-containing protein [Hymenobacter arizonensis]
MTKEELKQDFDSARIKHVHFKGKLRTLLFGSGSAEGPTRDPEQCSLGIWIANRLRNGGVYAHLPEAREFDHAHRLIHQVANRLMDTYKAGQREEALAGFPQLQTIADKMMSQLQTMEAKMRTEA